MLQKGANSTDIDQGSIGLQLANMKPSRQLVATATVPLSIFQRTHRGIIMQTLSLYTI